MELDPIYYNATRKLAILKTKIFLGRQFHQNWSFQSKPLDETSNHNKPKKQSVGFINLSNTITDPRKEKRRNTANRQIRIQSQPLPINIDNFFLSTKGDFKELKKIPKDFNFFFKSKSSKYYTNKGQTSLVRVSDHWGYNIAYCAWFIIGYEKVSSYQWNKKAESPIKIGRIKFKDLKPNN